MSQATRVTRPPAAEPATRWPPVGYRFTVEQYHEMGRLGILTKGDRVELLDGWVVPKMTINPAHAYALTRLGRYLTRLLDDSWAVRIQQPVTIASRMSEPEPDVVVAVGPDTRYRTRHPGAKEVAIVAEVSDSTLDIDQGPKLALYAAAKFPVYWAVNIPDRCVEVYTSPRGGKAPAYRERVDYGQDAAVPVVLGGREVGSVLVRELMPQ